MPNKKKNQPGRFVEKWLSIVFLIANVAALLLCHILTTAIVDPGVPNAWRDYGTPLLITVLVGQVIIQIIKIKEHTTLLTEKVKDEEMFVFKPMTVTHEVLMMISGDSPVRTIKIICYGTGLFGGVMTALCNNPQIKASAVVCSPDIDIFGHKGDQVTLKNSIKEMKNTNNLTAIETYEIPFTPTVRAVVMYDYHGNPIWCAMQPYYIYLDNEDKYLRGEGYSPAVVMRDKNSPSMKKFADAINDEFERLKNLGKEYADSKAALPAGQTEDHAAWR